MCAVEYYTYDTASYDFEETTCKASIDFEKVFERFRN